MKYEIRYAPSFSLLELQLEGEESLRAEPGAMVSMSPNIEIESKLSGGGIFGALKSVMGGESAFSSYFTAKGGPGEITLAPKALGDILSLELKDQAIFAQSGAFLAGSKNLNVDTKWGGAGTFFMGEGLFLLKISGSGPLFLSSFGAIHKKSLTAGEKYVVDTGHIVAFSDSVQFTMKKAARGLITSFTSGEGIVAEFEGPGDVYLQSRHVGSFAQWLAPFFRQGGLG